MIENNSDNTQIKNADEMMHELGFEKKWMEILVKIKLHTDVVPKMIIGSYVSSNRMVLQPI